MLDFFILSVVFHATRATPANSSLADTCHVASMYAPRGGKPQRDTYFCLGNVDRPFACGRLTAQYNSLVGVDYHRALKITTRSFPGVANCRRGPKVREWLSLVGLPRTNGGS